MAINCYPYRDMEVIGGSSYSTYTLGSSYSTYTFSNMPTQIVSKWCEWLTYNEIENINSNKHILTESQKDEIINMMTSNDEKDVDLAIGILNNSNVNRVYYDIFLELRKKGWTLNSNVKFKEKNTKIMQRDILRPIAPK